MAPARRAPLGQPAAVAIIALITLVVTALLLDLLALGSR
jgi:hypothetical protein